MSPHSHDKELHSQEGHTETARRGHTLSVGLAAGLPVAAGALLGVAYFAFGALPPVPQPIENPITEQKRVLGKILFWDEQLSTSNVVSCGTCHQPARGGADPRIARNPGIDGLLNTPDDILGSAGIIRSDEDNNYVRDPVFGLAPQITGRSANVTINAAYAPELFWDGRARSQFVDPQTGQIAIVSGGALESQAIGPITNTVEKAHENVDWAMVSAKLSRVRPLDLATAVPADMASAITGGVDYPELFRRAFGDTTINAKRIAFAIATYQRTLIADQTPFDRTQAGQPGGLTPQQQQGFQAFQASNCNACHTAPLFSDNTFRNIGLRPPAEDTGRQQTTGLAADRGKFKVPNLRNSGLKRTFMHNGQFTTLAQVIAFYARAPGAPQQFPDNRDPIMQQVNVPPQAATIIQDFIANGLTDPRVAAQTFPFDRPTLFTERASPVTTVAPGTAGAGGLVPIIITQAPPMVGNQEFRVGVDRVPAGASARLVLSPDAPVNGVVAPVTSLPSVTADINGTATVHWPLIAGRVAGGQTLYAQWIITDSAAPGGQSRSAAVRINFFCGLSGCPSTCTADFNHDGDSGTDQDIEAFFACLAGNCCNTCGTSDFNGDGDAGTDADIEAFFRVLAGGAC